MDGVAVLVADPALDVLACSLAAGLRDAIEADAAEIFPDSVADFEIFSKPPTDTLPGSDRVCVHIEFRVEGGHPWEVVLAALDEVRTYCWQSVPEGWSLQWRSAPDLRCHGLVQRWRLVMRCSFVPPAYTVWKGAEG